MRKSTHLNTLLVTSVDSDIESQTKSILDQLLSGLKSSAEEKEMKKKKKKRSADSNILAHGSGRSDRVDELKSSIFKWSECDNQDSENCMDDDHSAQDHAHSQTKTRWQRFKKDLQMNKALKKSGTKKRVKFVDIEHQGQHIEIRQASRIENDGYRQLSDCFDDDNDHDDDDADRSQIYRSSVLQSDNMLHSVGNNRLTDGSQNTDDQRTRKRFLKQIRDKEKERKDEQDQRHKRKQLEEIERLRRENEDEIRKQKMKEEYEAKRRNDEVRRKIQEEDDDERRRKRQIIDDLFVCHSVTFRLKLLNRYFSLWKARLRPLLLKQQKIDSIISWRLTGRYFRNWVHYVQHQKQKRQRVKEREWLLQIKRMEDASIAFYRNQTLRRFLNNWCLRFKVSRERRLIREDHESRRRRMERTLENLSRVQRPAGNDVKVFEQEQACTPSVPSAQGQDKLKTGKPETPIKDDDDKDIVDTTSPAIQFIENSPPRTENIPSQHYDSNASIAKKRGQRRMKRIDSSPPQFLMSMEARAKERKERWEQLQQRYREVEEEKQRQKRIEEEKAIEEENERLKEIAEAKKREMELQQRMVKEKEERKIRNQMNRERAKRHRQLSLMKFYGWRPLRQLLNMSRRKELDAEQFHKQKILQSALQRWKDFVAMVRRMETLALCAHVARLRLKSRYRMLQSAFHGWHGRLSLRRCRDRMAQQHYNTRLLSMILSTWKRYVNVKREERRVRTIRMIQIAERHAKRFTMRFYLNRWRLAVRELKTEQEKEIIGRRLQSKVNSWLRDFRRKNDLTDWQL